VTVAYGGATNFVIAADAYSHIGSILTNGQHIAGSPYSGNGLTSTNFVWSNIVTSGTLSAAFALNLAPMGTPEIWLAQYGLTNGTPAAEELTDTDVDGMLAWQEYVAGTDPTNGASLFLSLIDMSSGSPYISWSPDLGTSRLYTVFGRTNLVTDAWGATNAASQFFRVSVGLP
jgi:hypothetical protein